MTQETLEKIKKLRLLGISPGPLAFRHFFFGGEARNTANLALLALSLKLQYQHK